VGEESDQLRREIEETRDRLGTDVDALTEKVSPKKVVGRQVDKAKGGITGLKEKVMGKTSDVTSSTGQGFSSAASSVSDTASSAASSVTGAASSAASTVAGTASSAASATRRQAEGNPLAAGLIAFGIGWLVSSILPASDKEKELASRVKDQAQPALQPVAEKAQQALSEVKDNLQEPAQQAVESVKSTAQDAASTVQDHARSKASDVKDDAVDAGQTVRQQSPAP